MGKRLLLTNSSLLLSFALLSLLVAKLHALPLSTDSRWIVDEKGQRVKLACVNWPSHLELVVAEGLTKQPVDVISKKIKDMGFNCVRLTYPIYLVTSEKLASLTARQSFLNAGLSESIVADLQANNPSLVDLPLISVLKAVVTSLTKHKVMVILDNHISKPGWCCSITDGNGFFFDKYFDPKLWIKGLTTMATLTRNNPNVIGMSLRNELRGPRQNTKHWYRYMQRAAEAVHKANPNVLVILSGFNFDTDLSFLAKKPVSLSFTGKLAFEVHQYSFNGGWDTINANQNCMSLTSNFTRKTGFLLDQGFPLFLGEWGIKQVGTTEDEIRFANCIIAWAVEHDVDWAIWGLAGSFLLRQGQVGMNDTFGLLDPEWSQVRNQSFLDKISALQSPFQGPDTTYRHTHQIIFHPSTGLCILYKPFMGVHLGKCSESNHWIYTTKRTLEIKGSYFSLQAQGLNLPPRLTIDGLGTGTKWDRISDSKLHLAAELSRNISLCLDVDSNNNVFTTICKCLSKDSKCDPGSQWFKIADAHNFYY